MLTVFSLPRISIEAAMCTDGSVRVISGDGLPSNEGRVEVCHGGVWGAILDENWTNRDAAVVCRQMGYPSQGQSIRIHRMIGITQVHNLFAVTVIRS